MALSVPLSRFTSPVGGGSAFYVRHRYHAMNSTPETKGLWWKKIAFGLEAYIVLASIVVLIWIQSYGAINIGVFQHQALLYLLLGCIVSFFALIPTGIFLILRRHAKWGWVALAFASYTLVFLLLFLPALASRRF